MMESWKRESRGATVGLTLLRMITGVILAAHGWEKLVGYQDWHDNVAGMGLPLPALLAPLSIAAELGGGVALVLGLLTRLAALGVVVNMAVAIATVHLSHGLFARDNGFEFPLLLLTSGLFFMLRGAGVVSLDALWSRPGQGVTVEHTRYGGRREYPAH
jgi:putative oxidoreductase